MTNNANTLQINSIATFNLGGAVSSNDLQVFRNTNLNSAALGDVLVLSAGSVTSSSVIAAAAPPSGLYEAIAVDNAGIQLATSVPEPAGVALAALPLLATLRRRR